MESTKAKRGRKSKDHRCSWDNKTIDGLYRKPNGSVWRVRATGQEFTESDERLAVAKFHRLLAEHEGNRKVLVSLPGSSDGGDVGKAMVAAAAKSGNTFVARVPRGGGPIKLQRSFDSSEVWAYFREQLLARPKWVAQKVGIEQLGWLTDVKRPVDSAKLSTLIDAYASKPKLSPNEASRSKLFWKQFVRAVGVERVGEIGHEQVIAYERVILGSGLAPKSIHHRFSKVRTVVAYGLKRGIDITGCRQALDALALLEIKDAHPVDPRPIDVAEFWKIHDAAIAADDQVFATMMLVAANCAAYGGEVAAMKWTEVDLKAGTYVGRRPKTKISRVAMLWPEVVEALGKIERREVVDYIFNTARRSFTSNAVMKCWSRYREKAKLGDEVTFGRIRDAAYSIACQSASLDQAKVLAGHAFGGASDFYIRRNPQFVTAACEAIRAVFYAARKKQKK